MAEKKKKVKCKNCGTVQSASNDTCINCGAFPLSGDPVQEMADTRYGATLPTKTATGLPVELLAGLPETARTFSAAERKKAASSGAAMPDGSFPIHHAGDLSNAIRLAGNAKDPAAAKAHIKKRAKALGLHKAIPDTWS
jgi:hypothetical protein